MTTIEFTKSLPTEQILSASDLTIRLPQPPRRFYRHGWQSWSLTAWTNTGVSLPIQKPELLHPMQSDPAYTKIINPHGSWVGAVDTGEEIILLGSLGLDAHVILEGSHLEGHYETGSGEWLIIHGDESTVFAKYADELGKKLGIKSNKEPPRVWCSWYSLYTAVDENTLLKVFDELVDLPFDVLQVDDGWQMAVGDWEANEKFPSGMSILAEKIKSMGRKAGLWLAPLIAVESSKLFQNHPEWFLRNEQGRLISAGFNWGERLYALDTTHPDVLHWLATLMQKVRAWGFDYVKLDFLYGSALPGVRRQNTPREVAYRNGLKVIRESLGAEAYLLTCGTPIIPSLGLCDAMRVGPDVASEWENHRDAVLLYNPSIPGTRNAIRTTLNRLWLRPLVQIDPDVTYFRSKYCLLTTAQKELLQDLALICNFKATSDPPGWLSSDEREKLRKFLLGPSGAERTGPYNFHIEDREISFESAIPLPKPPSGLDVFQGRLLGWLANQSWIMRLFDQMNQKKLDKLKEKA